MLAHAVFRSSLEIRRVIAVIADVVFSVTLLLPWIAILVWLYSQGPW
jgi:hypothetical protein